MTNVAANAIVGKPAVQGGIFVAPLGTALPTNESTVLNSAFQSVGYLTDAGLARSRKVDSDLKRAWGGDPLILISKGTTRSAKFGLAEYLSKIVQETLHGPGSVTETAATTSAGRKIAIADADVDLPHLSWVIQLFSGTAVGRIVFPDCQVTDFEDWTYKDDDIAARPVTLTQWKGPDGKYANEYWDDGRKVLS